MDERAEIVTDFNNPHSPTSSPITTYAVGGLRLNLHDACARDILIEPALKVSLELQAIGRIRRLGQKYAQNVWFLYMEHTINRWFEYNIFQKAGGQIATNIAGTEVLQCRVGEFKLCSGFGERSRLR